MDFFSCLSLPKSHPRSFSPFSVISRNGAFSDQNEASLLCKITEADNENGTLSSFPFWPPTFSVRNFSAVLKNATHEKLSHVSSSSTHLELHSGIYFWVTLGTILKFRQTTLEQAFILRVFVLK